MNTSYTLPSVQLEDYATKYTRDGVMNDCYKFYLLRTVKVICQSHQREEED